MHACATVESNILEQEVRFLARLKLIYCLRLIME